MAVAGAQIIGPMEVDRAGDLVGRLGTHNKAQSLIKRHGQNWPQALTDALALPKDMVRSLALDQAEVEDAVRALSGRRAFVRDTDEFEEAAVRGLRPKERVISILFRKPSGRLAQGVIPYRDLPRSEAAYERLMDRARGLPPGVPVTEETLERVAGAETPVDVDERVQAAEDATRQSESEKREMAEQLRALRERLDAMDNPEPWEGYGEATAEEKLKRLEDGGLVTFGTRGLEDLIAFEENRPNPHRSVVRAAQALLDEAENPATE